MVAPLFVIGIVLIIIFIMNPIVKENEDMGDSD